MQQERAFPPQFYAFVPRWKAPVRRLQLVRRKRSFPLSLLAASLSPARLEKARLPTMATGKIAFAAPAEDASLVLSTEERRRKIAEGKRVPAACTGRRITVRSDASRNGC